MEQNQTCCCCFSLKTGVWLIGGLVILNVISGLYQAGGYGTWGYNSISLALNFGFCILFLIMMVSPSNDTFKLRNGVFLYYLIALTLVPAIITILAVFGVGWNIVDDVCN